MEAWRIMRLGRTVYEVDILKGPDLYYVDHHVHITEQGIRKMDRIGWDKWLESYNARVIHQD
jgi:hypothetical protein